MIDRIERFVYRRLSGDPEDKTGWACVPPGDQMWFQFGEIDDDRPMYTANTSNDGSEIWLCYSHGGGWLVHFRQQDARQLAWFILWTWWGKSTWFGLKRRIWYWALRRKVSRMKRKNIIVSNTKVEVSADGVEWKRI